MSAVLWCQDHIPTKTIAHKMYDVVNESGLSALQLYVQNYKQADLALTGTVRKANLMMAAAKMSGLPVVPSARRTSASATTAAAAPNGASNHSRNREPIDAATNAQQPGEKVCITCGIDVTPRWWPIEKTQERQLTNGHHGAIGFEAQKFVEQRKFQCHKCKKNPRTPKSFAAARPSPPPVAEPPRQHLGGSQSQTPAPPSLRSPSRVLSADYRAAPLRPEIHSLLHHPSSHGPSAPGPSAAHGPPPAGHPATHSQAHSLGSRPGPVSHGYPQVPPPRTTYNDWGSQHGSPTRHINGGPPPPPLHNTGPPPASGLTALRPPSMSGPPPVAAVSVPHQRPHGSPIYGSTLPPSPRRLNGTTASSAYVPSYVSAPTPAHASGPRHSASPGLSNGVLPPRSEGFSHGLHPQRPSYTGGTHGSPPLARSGLPPPGGPPPAGHESAHSAGGLGHRPPENRPASGASASPSLRNLLS